MGFATLSVMNPLAYLRTVLWAFLGIRPGGRPREEGAALRPVPLLLTMVVLATLFVMLLVAAARFAVAVGS